MERAIGPFWRAHGWAASCRRLPDALKRKHSRLAELLGSILPVLLLVLVLKRFDYENEDDDEED